MFTRKVPVALAILCLLAFPVRPKSSEGDLPQVSEARVKAAVILNIAREVRWPNERSIENFRVGVMDADTILLHELHKVEPSYLIRGKPFNTFYFSNESQLENIDILYLSSEFSKNLFRVYRELEGRPTLIITDGASDRALTMINLTYNAEKKAIAFEVNRENMESRGFRVGQELLLLGGSYMDIKELYVETSKRLNEATSLMAKYQEELDQLGREHDEYLLQVEKLENQLANLSDELKRTEQDYSNLTLRLHDRDSLLGVRNRELQLRINESTLLQGLIQTQLDSIKNSSTLLDSLNQLVAEKQKELQAQQNLINNQGQVITEKESTILQQQRKWYITLILLLGVLSSLIFASISYTTKRRMNLRLENLVEERTRELNASREHFKNLFENSPVAMIELNFSALKDFSWQSDNGKVDIDSMSNEEFSALMSRALTYSRVVDANNAAIKLFGYADKKDFMENPSKTLTFQSLVDYRSLAKLYFNNQPLAKFETTRQTTSGETIHAVFEWLVLPGYENTYERVLLAITDITALKKYEKELTRHKDHLEEIVLERTREIIKLNEDLTSTNAELKQKTEELTQTIQKLGEAQNQLVRSEKLASLGMLTTGIAHEINNPLNYISGSQQALGTLLEEMWKLLNSYRDIIATKLTSDVLINIEKEHNQNINDLYFSMKFLLSNIETGISRANSIVKSLRVFLGESSQEMAEYSIPNAVGSILTILKSSYFGKIRITEEYSPDLPLIHCSAEGVNQVIMNLLTNAIDAIPEKGEINITATYEVDGDCVAVQVRDNGMGIAKENIDRIFDPFFTTKETGSGTGLGLYLAYNIVIAHHGSIEVDSAEGVGTTFTLRLPRMVPTGLELPS